MLDGLLSMFGGGGGGGLVAGGPGDMPFGAFGLLNDPKQAMMLGLASGLLQAGGRSNQPVSFGQAMGAGLQNAAQFGGSVARNQMIQLQTKKMQDDMAEAQRKRNAWNAYITGAQPGGNMAGGAPGTQVADASGSPVGIGGDPTRGALANMTPEQIAVLQALGPDQGAAMLAQRAFKDADPITLKEGDTLIDRRTMRPVASGSPKTEARPWWAIQGNDGTFGAAPGAPESIARVKGAETSAQEWAKVNPHLAIEYGKPREVGPGAVIIGGVAGANGGKPVYTSPNPAPGTQQGKFEAGLGELQAKTVEAWQKDANNAASLKRGLSQITDMVNKGLQTGIGANFKADVSNVMQSVFGVDRSVADSFFNTADAATFKSASNDLVRSLLGSLGTGVSNADRDFIERIVPQLRDTPQAVTQIVDYMNKRADQQIAKFHEGYTAAQRGVDPLRFDMEWAQKYGTGMSTGQGAPQRPDQSPSASPQRSGGAQAATMPQRSKVINGETYVQIDGQWYKQK
jgi:hypothetical protein